MVTLRETGISLRGCASRVIEEEDEGIFPLSRVDGPGRDPEGPGRGAELRNCSDCSSARARSSSWASSTLARSLSACADNFRASSNSSSSFILNGSAAGDFAEGEVGRAVSFGSCPIELDLGLGETLGCASGCGPGLRITASEGERAPRGFGGGVGGGGGSGGTCGGADAPCGISGRGWDRDRGNNAGGRRVGEGMNCGGLGGKVGEVVGDIITGVFGGSGGTADWGSRDCGIGSGGGGGGRKS